MLKVQIQREAALSHAVFGKGCPVTISSVLALNVLFFISGQHEASRRRRLALQHQELPHQGRRRCLDLLHHRRRLCPVCHPPFEGVEDGLIQMNRTKHLVRHFSTCLNKWKFNIRLIASFLLRGAMCQFLGFWGQQIWAQISNYRETSGLEPRTCEIGTWKTVINMVLADWELACQFPVRALCSALWEGAIEALLKSRHLSKSNNALLSCP